MHEDRFTFERSFFDQSKEQLTEDGQKTLYRALIEHVFAGKEPFFTEEEQTLSGLYDKISKAIDRSIEEKRSLEEKVDDLDFLLTPGAVRTETRDRFIRDYIIDQRPFPTSLADDAINSMLYEDFLQTPYWKSISHYVKQRDDHQCYLCGSTKFLIVHHTSYLHHGDELHHLEDLITLCRHCHDTLHGKNVKIGH